MEEFKKINNMIKKIYNYYRVIIINKMMIELLSNYKIKIQIKIKVVINNNRITFQKKIDNLVPINLLLPVESLPKV